MSSVIQVNRIYLIFNPVHFLVDSSDMKELICPANVSINRAITYRNYDYITTLYVNEPIFTI